jgi:hypothetical protein
MAEGGGMNSEYPFTTADLATEFRISPKTIRRKAAELHLGIDLGGRAGFRYSEADRRRFIESLKPEPAVTPRRRRRSA